MTNPNPKIWLVDRNVVPKQRIDDDSGICPCNIMVSIARWTDLSIDLSDLQWEQLQGWDFRGLVWDMHVEGWKWPCAQTVPHVSEVPTPRTSRSLAYKSTWRGPACLSIPPAANPGLSSRIESVLGPEVEIQIENGHRANFKYNIRY